MSLRPAVVGLAAAALVAASAPGTASASSLAGLQISVGKFTLHVYYSVALAYPDHSDRAIRDPRAVLFAVSALVQANAERFAGIDHDLAIELGMRTDSPTVLLTIEEDIFEKPEAPSRKYAKLSEVPVQADVTDQIVAAICGRYPSACVKPAADKVSLFVCPAAPCDGQVAFGSFPSTSLNRKFSLLQPKGRKAKAFVVTPKQMAQYYEPLD
jgi:hypothetical protein